MLVVSVHNDGSSPTQIASRMYALEKQRRGRRHEDSRYVFVTAVGSDEAPHQQSIVRQGDRFWLVVLVEKASLRAPSFHLLLQPWKKGKTVGVPTPGERLLLARSCCLDRPYGSGCTDESCMALPPMKTCKRCIHVGPCVNTFGQNAGSSYCQFFPRRYKEASDE